MNHEDWAKDWELYYATNFFDPGQRLKGQLAPQPEVSYSVGHRAHSQQGELHFDLLLPKEYHDALCLLRSSTHAVLFKVVEQKPNIFYDRLRDRGLINSSFTMPMNPLKNTTVGGQTRGFRTRTTNYAEIELTFDAEVFLARTRYRKT